MPTSVLLAVLAGAGLLALAPALVRRYDADERIAADREASTARVLDREANRGRNGPLNPPTDSESATIDDLLESDDDEESALRSETPAVEPEARPGRRTRWERRGARRAESVLLGAERQEAKGRYEQQEVPVASARLRAWWQRRYRRVLYVLLALNFAELLGVIFLGPGFWLGVAISVTLLVVFLRFLRVRARRQQRRRPAVRVPSQNREEPELPEAEYEPEYAEEDDIPDEESVPVAEAPSRRRTGGIRGRSYESPANL
ncbi:MAG: hypothetical protein ACRD0P_06255 [Stackebrandtia sp.]